MIILFCLAFEYWYQLVQELFHAEVLKLPVGDFVPSNFEIEVTIMNNKLWIVPSGRPSNQHRPSLLLGHEYEELRGL